MHGMDEHYNSKSTAGTNFTAKKLYLKPFAYTYIVHVSGQTAFELHTAESFLTVAQEHSRVHIRTHSTSE